MYRGIEYASFLSSDVNVLFYNIPLLSYHLSNDYYDPLLPATDTSLLLQSTSSPVTRVFAIQLNPIVGEDEYIRGVVTPAMRAIQSNITSPQQNSYYLKLYLPHLILGDEPRSSQTITLTGKTVTVYRQSNVERVRVTVSFPQASNGFDNSFFHLPALSQILSVPEGTELEFYASEVEVDIGL